MVSWIQDVVFAAHAVLVAAADFQFGIGFLRRLHGKLVAHQCFARQNIQAHAFNP
jgi:hypothetical protein